MLFNSYLVLIRYVLKIQTNDAITIFKYQVFFYSSATFSTIGFVEDKVYWGIISTGIINLIATTASVKLVETFGRRPLILYPLAIITFIMILLCIFIQIHIRRFLTLI
jgi:hypothetical protein